MLLEDLLFVDGRGCGWDDLMTVSHFLDVHYLHAPGLHREGCSRMSVLKPHCLSIHLRTDCLYNASQKLNNISTTLARFITE